MTFTDEDFAKQEEQFQALQEELSRLNSMLESHKKNLGVSDQDLKAIDLNNVPAELRQEWSKAQEQAKRAGAERAAQMQNVDSGSKNLTLAAVQGQSSYKYLVNDYTYKFFIFNYNFI